MTSNPSKEGKELDRKIRAWSKLTVDALVRKLLSLGLHDRVELAKTVSRIRTRGQTGKRHTAAEPFLTASLRSTLKKFRGEPDVVGISFARHGIFVERGVGKYRSVGSPPAEAAKKPWLAVVLPSRIEEFADILAEHYGETATAQLKILIPGILNIQVVR